MLALLQLELPGVVSHPMWVLGMERRSFDLETRSHESEIGLKLASYPRMTLNSKSSVSVS